MADLSALKFGGDNAGPIREALGLATDDAVTFGSLTLGTALTVAQGGTGATSAAAARANLGVTAANVGLGTSDNVTFAKVIAGRFESPASINAYLDLEDVGSGNRGLQFDSTDYIDYNTTSNTMRLVIGGFTIISASGPAMSFPNVYFNTTASAANVNIDSAGTIVRSTSAKKYKRDWEPISDEHLDAFYEIAKDNAVWYRSRAEADPDDWSYYGFLADPFADQFPQLVMFGADGEVEGFAYERTSPFHTLAIVNLRGQVAARDAVIADLTSRLEALEAIVGVNDGT